MTRRTELAGKRANYLISVWCLLRVMGLGLNHSIVQHVLDGP